MIDDLDEASEVAADRPQDKAPCWTLFITGPRVRSWGFHCPERGWVPWKEFTAPGDKGAIGAGCGDAGARTKPVTFGYDAAKGDDMTAVCIVGGRQPGRATNEAIAERDAYRAEVALMARGDAAWEARSIAAKLTARVKMRMAARGSRPL